MKSPKLNTYTVILPQKTYTDIMSFVETREKCVPIGKLNPGLQNFKLASALNSAARSEKGKIVKLQAFR